MSRLGGTAVPTRTTADHARFSNPPGRAANATQPAASVSGSIEILHGEINELASQIEVLEKDLTSVLYAQLEERTRPGAPIATVAAVEAIDYATSKLRALSQRVSRIRSDLRL